VFDGKIAISSQDALSFDGLGAEKSCGRVAHSKLSVETPARLMCFGLCVDAAAKTLTKMPLAQSRRKLE
jgi:hypothetical protein